MCSQISNLVKFEVVFPVTCAVLKIHPASHCVDNWFWLFKNFLLHEGTEVTCLQKHDMTMLRFVILSLFQLQRELLRLTWLC